MNAPDFAWSHFANNRAVNLVLVPLFWGAALVSFVKYLFSYDPAGGLITLVLAVAVTALAFHKHQNLLRSIALYLVSILLLILDKTPENVVSFCFLAVSLSFLVNERKILSRVPYFAIALILGYTIALVSVALLNSRPTDISVLYPELGGFLVIVILFKDLFLPRPVKDQQKPELRLSNFGLTDRELQILHLTWGGHTTKEIAAEIGQSEGGVRNQFSRIYRKLRVPGLAELLVLAHSHEIMAEEKESTDAERTIP